MYELAALGAALCWALTGIVATGAARALGGFGFSFYREIVVIVFLGAVVLVTGAWAGISAPQFWQLTASGLAGIFLGDTILFMGLARLGPRRTGALFALNAPMAALLGWAVLGETLSLPAWCGVFLCSLGVGVAVLGRPGRSGGHDFEAVRGPLWIGVTMGLVAALAQAVGALIARPVMASGSVDPVAASLVRVAVCLGPMGLTMMLIPTLRPQAALTRGVAARVVGTAFLGMAVGMTLLLFALSGGKVGIVSTLSALSPVLILPLLWIATGQRPSATSWLGAGLAVAGMALIFLT